MTASKQAGVAVEQHAGRGRGRERARVRVSEGETGVGGGMGPRSALCAAREASDRQDDLTAGVGGEALGFGGLGASPPSSAKFSQSAPPRNGQLAGRDWIGAGRAGLGLGLDFGSDGFAASGEPEKPEPPACHACPALPESHGLRAPSVGTQGEPTLGTSPRLGKWAGGQGGQGGQVDTLGRKPPATTGGSSSSGVQLETWARGGGRLGRQLGGPAEGCTSPPSFLPSFLNTTAETLSSSSSQTKQIVRYRSHHEPWQHMAAIIPSVHMPTPGLSMMKQAGCPLPRRQAHTKRQIIITTDGQVRLHHSSSIVSIYYRQAAYRLTVPAYSRCVRRVGHVTLVMTS